MQFIVLENCMNDPRGSVYLCDFDRKYSKAELSVFCE